MTELWVDEVPDETPHIFVCDGSDEWSAIYVDGQLNRVGDHYLIDERIRELAGVVTLQSNDFLRGGSQRQDVAQTLDELREWRELMRERKAKADELREQAKRLQQEALKLEQPL